MKTLVLGVSGSVAAYRACDLARELMRHGWEVRACLTDGAQEFVSAALFEALTGKPCLTSVFEEPEHGRMAHIDWARAASLMVIAPATANTICRIAAGIGDDMLSTIALAYDGQILIAPAMNPSMYSSQQVTGAMQTLRDRGVEFIEPSEGDVACGENGQGKLASVLAIAEAVSAYSEISGKLAGRKVLITSGPTREAIDDVRYLTNRSSGKMGVALARAAMMLGAEVTVVSGPSQASFPARCRVLHVQSAQEMLEAAEREAGSADWIIGAAAVADYRPAEKTQGKIRRSEAEMTLTLVSNPDIIASLSKVKKVGAKVIGFAAEPSPDTAEAEAKLARKGLDAIVHNEATAPGIGFESDQNSVTLIRHGKDALKSGTMSKLACAKWLFEQLLHS